MQANKTILFVPKPLLTIAIFGALAVALGAFGAHGLEAVASQKNLAIYGTASRYHFYHLLPLFLSVWALGKAGARPALLRWSFRLTMTGILVFSGSLYLLGLRDILGDGISWLGAVTPIGGLLLIVGWLLLGLGARSIDPALL